MFQKKTLCLFIIALCSSSTNAQTTSETVPAKSLLSWEDLVQEARYPEALVRLQSVTDVHAPFYLGVVSFKSKNWTSAIQYLSESISKSSELKDYAYLFRGRAYLETKEIQKAYSDFQKAEERSQLEYLKDVAKFYQAEALVRLKQWAKAEKLYNHVKRPLKSTEYYSATLWGQLVTSLKQNKKQLLCRHAKELYLKYPIFESISSWGIDLSQNTVDGKKLGCFVTFKEQSLRLRRMLWAGMEDKAEEEIKFLQSKANKKDKYDVDELMVNYLLHVGYVDEALKVLKKYENSEGTNYDYLSLLGKTYSRNQQQKEAIQTYYQAYKITNKPGDAADALFQAAFLSYYSQDYSRAIKLFEEYQNKYATSRDFANATWYAAWCKYLNKDYADAGKDFISLLKKKNASSGYNRRMWSDHKEIKIKYWLAMTWYRQGLADKAINLFTELTHDDSVGYYSVAAYQRLRSLSQRGLASFGGNNAQAAIHENWWLPEAIAKDSGKVTSEEEQLGPVKDPFEEQVDQLLAQEGGEEDAFAENAISTNPSEQLAQDVKSLYFSTLERGVQRARTLTKVAETRFAHREILEVEGRKLTEEQRRWILQAHQAVHSYNRLVVLASYFYANDLLRLGIHHGKNYWEYSYPKAYEPIVNKFSKRFANLPPEFVWSIMRAETIYRPTAISPVGARGLMQVMPKTGRNLASLMSEKFELDDLSEPNSSILYGSYYLSRLLKKFNGKIPLVAAAYNGGPHRVHAWMHYFGNLDMDEFIEHIPYQETRNYAKKVTKYYAIYNLLYHKKTEAVSFLTEPLGFQLEGTIPTRETWDRM